MSELDDLLSEIDRRLSATPPCSGPEALFLLGRLAGSTRDLQEDNAEWRQLADDRLARITELKQTISALGSELNVLGDHLELVQNAHYGIHCPPGCDSHDTHYSLIEVLVGPLPEPVPPIEDGPVDQLITDISELAMPRRPFDADVSVSAWVTSSAALSLDDDTKREGEQRDAIDG